MRRTTIPANADEDLQQLLSVHPGLEHLQVKRRGASLTLFSIDSVGTLNHARVTWLHGATWALSLPRHTGRWEKTPFVGTLDELVQILTQTLGFYLARQD